MKKLIAVSNGERGAAFLEYALVVSLIAMLAMGTVQALGGSVADSLTESANAIVQGETVESSTTTTTTARTRPTLDVRDDPRDRGRVVLNRGRTGRGR